MTRYVLDTLVSADVPGHTVVVWVKYHRLEFQVLGYPAQAGGRSFVEVECRGFPTMRLTCPDEQAPSLIMALIRDVTAPILRSQRKKYLRN